MGSRPPKSIRKGTPKKAAPPSSFAKANRRRIIGAQETNRRGQSGGRSRSGGQKDGRSGGRPGGRRPGGGGGGPRSAASAPRDPKLELHPCTDIPEIEAFTEWDLCPEVQSAILEMGITNPTPIQRLTIGPVLKRKDVIAKAETGTGKTLAFGAGMVSLLDSDRSTVLGLVLCPTRELASQVHDVLAELGAVRGIKTALIVGGDPPQPQVKALQDGAQLVIGTPGRVMDLYNQGFLSFPWTEFVVLDEADEMLEIGFIDDIKKILSYTPDERTTLLFSATFPPALLKLAREYTTDPLEVATAQGLATVDHIFQAFIKVNDEDKWLTLVRLIENSDDDDVFLIFGDRRTDVDQLIRRMERMPFSAKALHGGYDQAARFRVMSAFRTGEVKVLVATDVASRGLDVKHVSHVVNFGVPRDVSIYTHRIGRTGRAGAKGNAITLVTKRDSSRWREVTGAMNWEVDEIPIPERKSRGGRRPAAPKRERSESRDEKPRENGEESRETKPRRRRSEGGESKAAQPAPKREENLTPEPAATAQPAPGGFGAGVSEAPAPKPKPKRTRKPQPKAAPAPPQPEPETEPKTGGFGAGI